MTSQPKGWARNRNPLLGVIGILDPKTAFRTSCFYRRTPTLIIALQRCPRGAMRGWCCCAKQKLTWRLGAAVIIKSLVLQSIILDAAAVIRWSRRF